MTDTTRHCARNVWLRTAGRFGVEHRIDGFLHGRSDRLAQVLLYKPRSICITFPMALLTAAALPAA